MKKKLVIVALALSTSFMYSQKHNVSIGYGVVSNDQIIVTMSMIFASLSDQIFGDKSYDESLYIGPLILSYHHTLASNERISLGGSFAFDHAKFKNDENAADVITFNAFTLAPEFKFKYLNPENSFNLYGLLGVGGTMMAYKYHETNNSNIAPHFNFQISPIGFEYGRKVKGFLDIGVGYKGVISGGVTFEL